MTRLTIFADYFQIYLCDPAHMEGWSGLWNDQTLDDRIVAHDHVIVFTTGRNMDVPASVSVHEVEPDMTALIAEADHAVMGSLRCESGELKLAGCTDYLPDGEIERQFRLDGDDHCALHLWPARKRTRPLVMKRWTGD